MTSGRSVAVLIACGVILLLGRVRLYPAPLYGDICAYAVIGHEMSVGGRPLYADLWERKPPLLYATFAAAERVTGYGRAEILLVGVAAAWVTLAGVYLAGGPFAAGLWTVLSADLWLTANQPDTEVFVNAAVAAAVAVLVRWPAGRRWWATAGLGVLLAAATLYKHNVALACGGLLVGHVLASGRGRRRAAVAESAVAGAVICLAWAGLLGYFHVVGRLSATVDVLFRQNLAYSGGTPIQNLIGAFSPGRLFPEFMAWAIGPAVLVVVGARAARGARWALWLAWAVGTWATVALTGKIYAHYYELWLPVACVGGGWAAAGLWAARGWRRGLVVVVLGCLGAREGGQFLGSPDEWVRRQFPYYSVADQNAFGRQLNAFLQPGETFWEMGEDNNLYFLANRSPPSGLLFIDPLLYGGETTAYWHRLMADLDRRPPDVVVRSSDWNWDRIFGRASPVVPWLATRYGEPWRRTTVGQTTYTLYLRRGGRLERRLRPR